MNNKQKYKLSEPYNYNNDQEYSLNDPVSFFDEISKKYVIWDKMYDQVYSGDELKPNWYAGGKLNVCYNVLDINALNNETKDNIALIHECPLLGIFNKITYHELWDQVCTFSRALKNIGIVKGDKVMISMPTGIRVAVAMLSCLRLGAIHCVTSPTTILSQLSTRIDYFKPKLLITQNFGISFDSSELFNPLSIVVDALKLSNFKIEITIVNNRKDIVIDSIKQQLQQLKLEVNIENSIDWDELVQGLEPLTEYEIVKTNDPIFISFTSGTTGNAKGLLFKSGEFAAINSYYTSTLYNLRRGDVIFPPNIISAKIYHNILYGSLKAGSTVLLLEGNTILPSANIIFEISSKHNVNSMFIFPKRIKDIQSIDTNGDSISNLNLSCLKNIFLVGEKFDESVITYLKKSIGNNNVVYTSFYGSSETHIVSTHEIKFPFKPNSIGFVVPGKNVEILSKEGIKLNSYERGELVIKLPLPPGSVYSMFNDDEYDSFLKENYFTKYPGYYNSGDAGYFDNENNHFVLSRVKDVANIDGHDIFVGELENIIISTNSMILDSVVVGVNDNCGSYCSIGNQTLVGFILFKPKFQKLVSTNPNGLLNSIQNDINNKLVDKFGGQYVTLKHVIPITIIPTTFNNKKIKYIFSKLYNGEPCLKSNFNIDHFNQLEFEINQFKKQHSQSLK